MDDFASFWQKHGGDLCQSKASKENSRRALHGIAEISGLNYCERSCRWWESYCEACKQWCGWVAARVVLLAQLFSSFKKENGAKK